jgi:hypothetical protein
MVLLMRDAGGFSSSTVTDAGGRYLLPGLRPGTYKLLAADDRTGALLLSLGIEDMGDYAGAVATVDLHAGDKVTKDLKQRPPP